MWCYTDYGNPAWSCHLLSSSRGAVKIPSDITVTTNISPPWVRSVYKILSYVVHFMGRHKRCEDSKWHKQHPHHNTVGMCVIHTVYVRACVHVCVCVCDCTLFNVCMTACVCVWMRVWVHTITCMCVSLCICMCIRACMHACLCSTNCVPLKKSYVLISASSWKVLLVVTCWFELN